MPVDPPFRAGAARAYRGFVGELDHLRPLERRVCRLAADGVFPAEIGRRFNRSEEFIERVLTLASLPDRHAPLPRAGLRPLERRLLRWRDEGVSSRELADRFRRGPGYIAQVLKLADYRLAHPEFD